MTRKSLLWGLLLLPAFSYAETTVFSCDSCTNDQLVEVAKSHAPPIQCPGDIDEPNGQQCGALAATYIVANPITRSAAKFRVRRQWSEWGDVVDTYHYSISSVEQELLNRWYSIDRDFRNAAETAHAEFVENPPPQVMGYDALKGGVFKKGTPEQCVEHPSNYLRGTAQQKALHDRMTQNLVAKMGGSSWQSYWSTNKFSSAGITLSKGSIGLNVNFSNNSIGSFAAVIYGDSSENKLIFKVIYNGESAADGKTELHLDYRLQESASLVDGMAMSNLQITNLNLAATDVSYCLLQAIQELGTTVPGSKTPGTGDPNANPSPWPRGDFDDEGGRFCTIRVKGSRCIHGVSCAPFEYVFPTLCDY